MKNRVMFLLSLAMFMNPISAFAQGERVPAASQTLCGKWKEKVLASEKTQTASVQASSGSPAKVSGSLRR